MTGIIVVDVQPSCDRACRSLLSELLDYLPSLEAGTSIILLKINEELSGDTLHSFEDYWREAGATDDFLGRVKVIEKSYAFFRGWMDEGVAGDEIAETARVLRRVQKNDSRSLDIATLSDLSEQGAALCDPLFLPDELEMHRQLFVNREWMTCGGGMNECLQEFEIWLDSLDVAYERIGGLCY